MNTAKSMRCFQVIAIVANVKQFRIPFYTGLAAFLARAGVKFQVLYSDPDPVEAAKGDSIVLPMRLGKKIPRLYLARNRLLLQFPPVRDIVRANLVIIVQANGYLLNYPLLVLSALGLKRIAFWGHGYNRQGNAASFSERLKRFLARATDWWFAYTPKTAQYLESIGVSPHKITVIENAVDTSAFRHEVESVTFEAVAAMRSRLGIGARDTVGLYCGSLYKEKRVPFLLECADRIAAQVPGFKLLVIGAGREAELVRQYTQCHPNVIYPGPLFGQDKAVCFRMAQVFLNPGLVGLGILDSFAAGLPVVTTKDGLHSPEIDYLQHGVNGLMLEGDVAHYVQGVADLLKDPSGMSTLVKGARKAAQHYTVENMVANVTNGITNVLSGH